MGVVSVGPSKTLIAPVFCATKIRPSGANRTAVGASRPVNTVVSWNPGSSPADPVLKVTSAPQADPPLLEAQAV